MKLYLNCEASIGNGTRPAGFLVGESTAEVLPEVNAENTTLADGVMDSELRNLLRNPELISQEALPASEPFQQTGAKTSTDEPWRLLTPPLDDATEKIFRDQQFRNLGSVADFFDSGRSLSDLGVTKEMEMYVLDCLTAATNGTELPSLPLPKVEWKVIPVTEFVTDKGQLKILKGLNIESLGDFSGWLEKQKADDKSPLEKTSEEALLKAIGEKS